MTTMFEVEDCRGFKVVCSQEYWYDKILGSHPWLKGWEELVKEVIHNPSYIFEDKDKPNKRQIYYMFHNYKHNRYHLNKAGQTKRN